MLHVSLLEVVQNTNIFLEGTWSLLYALRISFEIVGHKIFAIVSH